MCGSSGLNGSFGPEALLSRTVPVFNNRHDEVSPEMLWDLMHNPDIGYSFNWFYL